jgi:DNA mismatch repair protein MutL
MSGSESPIRTLDSETIRQIAAGEVVERPASVVKELLENSLDAGADRITIAVEEGGTDRIRIKDNGVGMSEEALQQAVKKHTTSKIDSIEDLESGLGTLGFRGEALHTIGAVAKMRLRSKPHGEAHGAELSVEGGEVTSTTAVGCPAGTIITVEELFYNTPARRKFLKTTATEFDHISTVVTQYALANPDVAISLEHNSRELFATEGQGDLQATILSVYGRDVAESMIDFETGSSAPVSAKGLISHPETTRSTREYLSTFINGRYVRSRLLREAVLSAYGSQLSANRYPFAVVFIDIPSTAVDVNVHPRKMEVRFDNETIVRETVEEAIKTALLENGLVRSGAPRGQSAPDEVEIDPQSQSEEAVQHSAQSPKSTEQDGTTTQGRAIDPDSETAWVVSENGPTGVTNSTGADDTDSVWSLESPLRGASSETEGNETNTSSDENSTSQNASNEYSATASNSSSQQDLTGEAVSLSPSVGSIPSLDILGQVDESYIVADSGDGIVLIDQHAADERVHYESLKEQFNSSVTTQELANPVSLSLTTQELARFDEWKSVLESLGFHATRTDSENICVSAVPAVLSATINPTQLRTVLADFIQTGEASGAVDIVADDLLADLACYPALTGNTRLTEGSVVGLLEALDDCENPYACPHGRPVVIQVNLSEIEERFERDYPGHDRHRYD